VTTTCRFALLNNNNNNHHSKNVSRINSNASQKINDGELMDISEKATTTNSSTSVRSTPPILLQRQLTLNDYDISTTSNYTKLKKNKKPVNGFEDPNNSNNNRKKIITLMGGRGYINWRHIWYNSSTDFQSSPNNSPAISTNSGGTTTTSSKHQRNILM
jgi:hypothetical protein